MCGWVRAHVCVHCAIMSQVNKLLKHADSLAVLMSCTTGSYKKLKGLSIQLHMDTGVRCTTEHRKWTYTIKLDFLSLSRIG